MTTDEVITTILKIISSTAKVILATTKVILTSEEVITAILKVISATSKVILASEEVITATLKISDLCYCSIFLAPKQNSRFLISDMHVQNKKYRNLFSISRLTGKCAAQKLKKTFAVLVYSHIGHIWSY